MDDTLCFAYDDYRAYLESRLATTGKQRGLRARMAKDLRCQSAYISRVLAGESHFSLEHAIQISRFLGHGDLEREYFLLLVEEARAGSQELAEFFREKREEVRARRLVIAERIKVKKELSREDQVTYYSSWLYAAIHVMLTVPAFQTVEEIARYLQLPVSKVSTILEFLEQAGLASRQGARYQTGETRIHLGKDSPMISRHHANWRLRAMQAMDQPSPDSLFFSGPISIAEHDVGNVRAKLLKLLEEIEPYFRQGKEECVVCLDLDFFRL